MANSGGVPSLPDGCETPAAFAAGVLLLEGLRSLPDIPEERRRGWAAYLAFHEDSSAGKQLDLDTMFVVYHALDALALTTGERVDLSPVGTVENVEDAFDLLDPSTPARLRCRLLRFIW